MKDDHKQLPWLKTTNFKGTVSVISCDPSCKDDNFWFTMVPFKAMSDQVWIRYQCFCFLKRSIFMYGFSAKVTCPLLVIISNWAAHKNKHFSS